MRYHRWSIDEDKALVEFLSIARTDPGYNWIANDIQWPSFGVTSMFWRDASKHIRESTASTFLLSSKSIISDFF